MIPAGKHTDLWWPLSEIPRRWTAIESDKPPHVCASDSLTTNPDVPNRGAWAWSFRRPLGFTFAATTKGGRLIRIGTMRYDYVDHYYQIPTFTIKKRQ